jgi:hypothetical protein
MNFAPQANFANSILGCVAAYAFIYLCVDFVLRSNFYHRQDAVRETQFGTGCFAKCFLAPFQGAGRLPVLDRIHACLAEKRAIKPECFSCPKFS